MSSSGSMRNGKGIVFHVTEFDATVRANSES